MDVNITEVTSNKVSTVSQSNSQHTLAVPIDDECYDFVDKLRHKYHAMLLMLANYSKQDWEKRVAYILFPDTSQCHSKYRQAIQKILRNDHPMCPHLPPIDKYFGYNMFRPEYMGKSEEEFDEYWKKHKTSQPKKRWGDSGTGKAVLRKLQKNMLWFTLVYVAMTH